MSKNITFYGLFPLYLHRKGSKLAAISKAEIFSNTLHSTHDFLGSILKLEFFSKENMKNMTNIYTFKKKVT